MPLEPFVLSLFSYQCVHYALDANEITVNRICMLIWPQGFKNPNLIIKKLYCVHAFTSIFKLLCVTNIYNQYKISLPNDELPVRGSTGYSVST